MTWVIHPYLGADTPGRMGAPTTATATLLLLLSLAGGALAANPIIKDMEVCKGTDPIHGMCGVADPNVHYFDGKFMIFATHDFVTQRPQFPMTHAVVDL